MTAKKAGSKETDTTPGGYPRKYWWMVLVAVPIVIAALQFRPWQRAGGASGGSSFTARDISIIVNEASQAGSALDEKLVAELRRAGERSQQGQHADAAASLQKVRAASRQLAESPTLLASLADEFRLAGKASDARQMYLTALKKDPSNERVLNGLSQLPDAPLEGVTLVNFSSERDNIWRDAVASNLVDGNPNSVWMSRDGQFPQTLIFQLPALASVSEMSFNNPAYGDAKRGAKDLEISVSSQSASSGFAVVTKATLAPNEIGQGIRLNGPTVGRWIKVRVLNNHGNAENTTLGDPSFIGRLRAN